MQTENLIPLSGLSYRRALSCFAVLLFVAGNVVLPQTCHLVPDGGRVFLPIYFFTLVGAYVYGRSVGLMTAVASPLVNTILFGMPSLAVLPAVMFKSTLLALSASMTASRFSRVSIPALAIVIVSYQFFGMAGVWLMTGSLSVAVDELVIGVPGMLLQLFGGYMVIRYLMRK